MRRRRSGTPAGVRDYRGRVRGRFPRLSSVSPPGWFVPCAIGIASLTSVRHRAWAVCTFSKASDPILSSFCMTLERSASVPRRSASLTERPASLRECLTPSFSRPTSFRQRPTPFLRPHAALFGHRAAVRPGGERCRSLALACRSFPRGVGRLRRVAECLGRGVEGWTLDRR